MTTPTSAPVCPDCGHPILSHDYQVFECNGCEHVESQGYYDCECKLSQNDIAAALASRVASLEAALEEAVKIVDVVKRKYEAEDKTCNPAFYIVDRWVVLREFIDSARRLLDGAK